MRRSLLLLLPFFTGCLDSGTIVTYHHDTHVFELQRSWLGGPFYAEFEVELSDGTKISGIVQSDANLDAAAHARAGDQETIRQLAGQVVELSKGR